MRIVETVLSVLGGFAFLAGLVFACLPSAAVRKLAARVFSKRS